MILIQLLLTVILFYVVGCTAWLLLLAIAGKFSVPKLRGASLPLHRILVMIPAYKEDQVIVETASQALNLRYPAPAFDVVVIADSLQADTLQQLRKLPIQVCEVSFEKSTKSKAINACLATIDDPYDMVFLLDADNQASPFSLQLLNIAHNSGWQAIQGQRIAKNEDTPMSLLDGMSEAMNNHWFCMGAERLGWSSRLAGSGMGFDFRLFKETMASVDAVGGFDKELELKLTRRGVRIHYLPEVQVEDEKVADASTFGQQRTRWIAAQWHYARHFPPALYRLVTIGQWDYFQKSLQMIFPPRLFWPLLAAVLVLVTYLIGGTFWYLAMMNLGLLAAAYLLAIPTRFFSRENVAVWKILPRAIGVMVNSIPNWWKANQTFIHTPHGITSNANHHGNQ